MEDEIKTRGLVFGKYYPFHLGHKSLIEFALSKCDFLHIVICASTKEKINVKTRSKWIRQTFNSESSIEIIELVYDENELPNTSVSSLDVSKKWSQKFLALLPKIDILVTSEKYGDYVAQFLNTRHLIFDLNRIDNPVSSTMIRNSIYSNWDFLPDSVKKYYQLKIVFLGTECTGKSSISKHLSNKYNSTLVDEVGRELIDDSNVFDRSKLMNIATLHASKIDHAVNLLKPFIFIDTDIHITQSYSYFKLGQYLDIKNEIYESNKADIYIYLENDLSYEQDGTRLSKSDRDKLDLQHRQTLSHFNVECINVNGNWNNRLRLIEQILETQLSRTV